MLQPALRPSKLSKGLSGEHLSPPLFTEQPNRIQYLLFWHNPKPNFRCSEGRSYDQMC